MAATKHLPKHQPKGEHDMPQGVKNWEQPPQQIDGPAGPEPHPTPEEAGAGKRLGAGVVSYAKKPQQVKPKGDVPDEQADWPPRGHFVSNAQRPQQVDGPEGPDPTDGSELIDAVNRTHVHIPEDLSPEDRPYATAAKAAKAPAKKTESKTEGEN